MANKRNTRINGLLFLIIFAVFLMPYVSSCGKATQGSAAGSNTQLEILNLSPDVGPVYFYLGYVLQNSTTYYTYAIPSGYFYLATLDTPLQVRLAAAATNNLFTIPNPGFQANHKYSLFITGQYSTTGKVDSLLTEDDNTITPNVGFGKIRFINLSIPNTPLDVIANGTTVFSNAVYLTPTAYEQVPAGNYVFTFVPSGTTAALSTTLTTTTIQDGRLYTLYSYGIVGLGTDTSAFNAGILTNR